MDGMIGTMSEHPMMDSAEDYMAEEDLRILVKAEKIRKDPARLKAALEYRDQKLQDMKAVKK